MGYRYCEECEKWLSTSEYTVSESGETICPKDGHGAVAGFIIDRKISHLPSGEKARRAKSQAMKQYLIE